MEKDENGLHSVLAYLSVFYTSDATLCHLELCYFISESYSNIRLSSPVVQFSEKTILLLWRVTLGSTKNMI